MSKELVEKLGMEISHTQELVAKILERLENVTGLKVHHIHVTRLEEGVKYKTSLVLHKDL